MVATACACCHFQGSWLAAVQGLLCNATLNPVRATHPGIEDSLRRVGVGRRLLPRQRHVADAAGGQGRRLQLASQAHSEQTSFSILAGIAIGIHSCHLDGVHAPEQASVLRAALSVGGAGHSACLYQLVVAVDAHAVAAGMAKGSPGQLRRQSAQCACSSGVVTCNEQLESHCLFSHC